MPKIGRRRRARLNTERFGRRVERPSISKEMPEGWEESHLQDLDQLQLIDEESRKGNTIVLVSEEYGHSQYLWFTDMYPHDLENWWRSQESLTPYWLDSSKLPGFIKGFSDTVDPVGVRYSCHLHDDDDSHLMEGDRVIYHLGREDYMKE